MTRQLVKNKVASPKSFDWLCQMRFYFDPKQQDPLKQLSIQMANAKFNYGFEYLGVQDKLVQTPLTDRCYLTMTQALEARLGGSPFGEDLQTVNDCVAHCFRDNGLKAIILVTYFRSCWNWEDRVCEGSWKSTGTLRAGL